MRKLFFLLLVVGGISLLFSPFFAEATTETFRFTNATSSWTVPTGVSSIALELKGSEGGGTNQASSTAGNASGTLAVTAGTVYYFCVGGSITGDTRGTGGFCGGGLGGANGFGGGGMTWFSTSGIFSSSSVIILSAGAGGNGICVQNIGGNGGGTSGTSGGNGSTGTGGGGGTQSAGGAAGTGGSGPVATAGGEGKGGTGGSDSSTCDGGGGGGGYFGGGGGGGGNSSGAGGGGSSFLKSTLTATSTATGAATSSLMITYTATVTSTARRCVGNFRCR